MLSHRLVSLRRALLVMAQLALIPLGYLAAFGLRFDSAIPPEYWRRYWDTLPFLFVVRVLVLVRYGFFRGMWQHFGLRDLIGLTNAVTLGTLLFSATLFLTQHLDGFPRSVLILDWLGALFLLGGIPWRDPSRRAVAARGADGVAGAEREAHPRHRSRRGG
jgi:FlaA1/EpsC-like NDP-sugar epimerase